MSYQGTLTLHERLYGWIEGSRCGVALQNIRTVSSDDLSEHMEFDHVIFSFGNGRIADVVGIWAPSFTQFQEHGAWTEAENDDPDSPWSLMHGYTGQHGYSGPWMHESEFIGGRMARDILSTPGLFVAIYPSLIANDPEEDSEADTWAVAYISENIPGAE